MGRIYKNVIVFALSIVMVFTMFPLSSGVSFAAGDEGDEVTTTETQETQEQTTEPSQQDQEETSQEASTDATEETESTEPNTEKEDKSIQDGDDSDVLDNKGADVETTEETEATTLLRLREAADESLPSGNVSNGNGWIWKVVGEESNYTLTFEYNGTADTPPTFTVPSSFISNISSSLGEIGKNGIKAIVIPEGCTGIGGYAFQNMDGIEEVEIASTVKSIGNVAFGDNDNTSTTAGCDKLKKVVIKTDASGKSSLDTIGSRAFRGCRALKEITNLENTSLKTIANGAFEYVAVEDFYLPDSWAKNNVSVGSLDNLFANNSSLKTISMPALFYIATNGTSRSNILANCPNLETVTFRTVDGASIKTRDKGALPSGLFTGDTNLKIIDLSAWEKVTDTASFTLDSSTFTNTNLNNLNKIILPKKQVVIGTNTFLNKTGIRSMDQFENREYITSIGNYAFKNSRIETADMSTMTRLTTIGQEAFRNCEELTRVVIPEGVTSIGTAAFKNCDNLESVRIESKKLTDVTESNLFHGDDNLKTVTISNKTEELNGNVLAAIPDEAGTFFEGENVITITKATKRGGSKPLKDLNGRYYVDPQGVLYKLSDDGKASLAYVPPGITSYTVPASFTTPGEDGAEYTVTAMDAYALNHAHDLMAIDFAAPQNVYLKASAFTGWSTSASNNNKTVQGKEAIDRGQWANVSDLCDFPISGLKGEIVKTIKQITETPNGKEVKIVVAVNEKAPKDDNTFEYLTGQLSTYTIAISNGDNKAMDKVARIYFSYSDDGYHMGSFPEGNYNIKNPATGTVYPMKVVQTDNPNIYYYEVTGILPGETLAFTNDIHYPAKVTGGGVVKIWTHTLDQDEAEATEGKVINPKDDHMELDWITSPVVYKYDKANANVYDTVAARSHGPMIVSDPSGEPYVSCIAYRLKESNESGSSSTTEGTDYIRWVNYSDEITLPEELYWRPEIINALNIGLWSVEDVSGVYYDGGNNTTTCKAITVTLGSKKYYLAYLTSTTGYGYNSIDNLKVQVVDDKKLKLTWKVANTSLQGASATNEYSVQSFYLRIGENVVLADLDKVNNLLDANPDKKLTELLKIHNETDEVRHYSFSPNQPEDGSADNPVDASYDVQISKTWQKNNSSYSYMDGGTDDFFNITINNTGIMNIKNWGKPKTNEAGDKIYDGRVVNDNQLSDTLYIEPANIQNMLNAVATLGSGNNAGTAPIGDWLTITISKASLYTPGQYQPIDGTPQGNNKYAIDSNLSHNNDNGMRVNENATFVIKKNDEGQITVTLRGDTIVENNKMYVIGSGGDYADIDALFTAIGYFPTRNTKYSLTYDVKGNFTLKPGQKLVFPIRTTYKTTPMMLTQDTESYLGSSPTGNNTAIVALQAGTDISKEAKPPKYHYWDEELTMYKYGYYTSGSSISNGATSVKDGSAIASTLSFTNTSGKPYSHIKLADKMVGAQVALVPVYQNQELKAPDGSELERYTDNGVEYYLLNKPGTYENVIFGRYTTTNSTNERNATQNWRANITVTETVDSGKRTSLNTTIIWNDIENWGATSTNSYMHYKSLVSANKAGLAGADNPGEQKEYKLDNKAWLGDHQGHRLWDKMGYYFQVYSSSKYIVSKDGKGDGTDSTSNGTLVDFSRVRQSDKVTYQITITNNSTSPTVLNGKRFYDTLPTNKDVFSWEKGVNVTNLRYYGSNGVEIKYGSGENVVNIPVNGQADEHWSIENTATAGQQKITWDDKFNVHFPVSGTLKILVDLEFPARVEGVSPWDRYVSEVAGKQLVNTFTLDGEHRYAYHQLESEGKAVLYKGVYDTGVTTKNPSSSDSSPYYYGLYTSNNTRLLYENGTGSNSISDTDLKASTITYYTVLYNGSYDRLYLSDLEDELPRGFTYNSMCYTSATQSRIDNYSSSCTGYIGYRAGNYNTSVTTEGRGSSSEKLVTIDKTKDPYDKNTVTYKSAYVSPTVTTVNGRQHITFKITGVGYDSEVGKYYLNPGECLRFGYNVLVDKYANTGDDPNDPEGVARNTITMPYYDYYHTGFILDAPDEDGNGGAVQKARAVADITPNDGKCELMTAEQVNDKYGMNIKNYTDEAYNSIEGGNFMVSSVEVRRAPITPGLQKTVGGLTAKAANPDFDTTIEGPSSGYGLSYKGGAKTSDVVNWKLRVFNEAPGKNEDAGGMMDNYTIVDTVDKPYGFTGRVYYDMYKATSANGSRVTKSTQYLFTIGTRKITENELGRDESVLFSSGNTLTGNTGDGHKFLPIGSAEDDSDDKWFSFGSGAKTGKVKLERDKKGKEILTIKMTGSGFAIPAGHWIDLCVHTMYTFDEVIISEPKYNDAVLYPEQGYDAGDVAQGRARTKQVTAEDGSIETVNDGIQSGASIMLNQGYTTASWKEITEIGDTTNHAKSDDSTNYIVLSEKSKPVKYDLYVIGPTTSVSRMVIIDDLPHKGDHSAFVDDDLRDSEFKMGFLEDNLGLRVALAQKTGENNGVNTYGSETVLKPSQYDVYVSTKTSFNRETDWIGGGTGWTDIKALEGDQLKNALKDAQSIRVIVKDPNAWEQDASKYIMSKEFRLHVTFNAKINDDKAAPGQTAWNSFGYKYQVPLVREGEEDEDNSINLEAQPLNVGLKYPNAPVLKKVLTEEVTETVETTDEETDEPITEETTEIVEHKTERDLNCNFIVYEGKPLSALDDISRMSDGDIAEILNNANRKYVYIPFAVKAGDSKAEKGLWYIDHCSKYSDGKFVDNTDQRWTWLNNAEYTLLEMNMEDGDLYNLDSISVDGKKYAKNNQVFANSLDTKIELKADNRYSDTDLILTKKMPTRADMNVTGEAGANSTVVFKIVGKNKAGQIKYRNTVGFSFDSETGASETKILKKVPSDLIITVTEAYVGNYKPKDGKTSITKVNVEPYKGDLEDYQGKVVWQFVFENELGDNHYGSGVVNQYENDHGTIKYKDGSQQPEPEPEPEPVEPVEPQE